MRTIYPRMAQLVMREEPIDHGVHCEGGMHAVVTLHIKGQHRQSLHVGVWRRATGSKDSLYTVMSGARRRVARTFSSVGV